jgi:outer membrane protein OmpA-like peptidoglycan-associated protein
MRAGLLAAAALGLLASCAQPRESTTVVVLADEDGAIGHVDVTRGSETVALDSANAAARIDSAGGVATATMEPAELDTAFGRALAARPVPPHDFILYFVLDSDALTPESELAFNEVFEDVSSRQHYEVMVIGHTDTLADAAYNQDLSLRRAEQVRDLLAGRGIPATAITAFGRGENDLLVPTADNISEPRNRRVEVVVR